MQGGSNVSTTPSVQPVILPIYPDTLAQRLPSELIGPKRPLNVEAALVLAVKVMLCVDLNPTPRERIPVGHTDAVWPIKQSLETLVETLFPTSAIGHEETSSMIKLSRLSARYLVNHVGVTIAWTRHLPDHLYLDVTENTKILRVFELASFLEGSYRSMRDSDFNTSLADSLKRQAKSLMDNLPLC